VGAIVVEAGSLVGTAGTIARAAAAAGYTVRATRSIGWRVPRVTGQEVVRQAAVTVSGTMGGWGFRAQHTERDGWDVIQHRPGWPPASGNTVTLLAVLRAQTPAEVKA
jgi:hypothetical protein